MNTMLTSRARLRQKAVQQIDVLGCLHLDGESEVLGRLFGDLWDGRDR